MLLILLTWLIQGLLVLLSVAFFTLFERKVMGLFHLRLGPVKVSFIGLFQPLLDAFKLLTKTPLTPHHTNSVGYSLSPVFSLTLSIFLWATLPGVVNYLSIGYSFVLFFVIGSVIVLFVLLGGWASNSKYSLVGSLRSISQSISYESVFSTLMIVVLLLILSFSSVSFINCSSLLFFLVLPVWVICTLAETHRAPFDFSESESELVSGFNTEYSGAFFAFIFLSEYSVLLFSCVLIVYVFFMSVIPVVSVILVVALALFISFIFIWIRVTYCRFRYDLLMSTAWNLLLPVALSLLTLLAPTLLV